MIEVTCSRRIHINVGNYESEEVLAAVKREYADNQCIRIAFEELNKEVEAFAEAEAQKIRVKVKK